MKLFIFSMLEVTGPFKACYWERISSSARKGSEGIKGLNAWHSDTELHANKGKLGLGRTVFVTSDVPVARPCRRSCSVVNSVCAMVPAEHCWGEPARVFQPTSAWSALSPGALVLAEKQVLAESNYNPVNEEGAA